MSSYPEKAGGEKVAGKSKTIQQELSEIGRTLQTVDFSNPDQMRAFVSNLLNLIEIQHNEIEKLGTENQQLKDEINTLKGQKGRPNIKPNIKDQDHNPDDTNFQSGIQPEKKKKKKAKKKGTIPIDRKKTIQYKGHLPPDARHKGYRRRTVQGIRIEHCNTQYCLERFYSESKGTLYEASLPQGCEDGYDPGLKAWIITCYYDYRIPEDKILQQLTDIGICISAGHISAILTKEKDAFHGEKEQIVSAGISSTAYQHMDDTGARVNGVNHHFSVLCNEWYSAFFITRRKDRMTVLNTLCHGHELHYTINEATMAYLQEKHVPRHIRRALARVKWPEGMKEKEFTARLTDLSACNAQAGTCKKIKPRYRDIILEAAAITWYQNRHSSEKIQILITDAAKQFGGITELNALCWVHEDRHYAKLIPVFDIHKKMVGDFREKIWDYYKKLKAYKAHPVKKKKNRLDKDFDELFSTVTGYDALDECIQKTCERKAGLLVVLGNPHVPLHNNPAELAVREHVVKRKISIQTRSADGTRSWETFLSIKDTCRKLGVNFREYLYDRLSGNYNLPSLADLLARRAQARIMYQAGTCQLSTNSPS